MSPRHGATTTATRRRLDTELVRRGLAPSREQAQAAIAAGRVLVSGAIADKPSRQVDAGEAVILQGAPPRFVGRGGEKLDAALGRFGIDVHGRSAVDAGASTGGFTDCLLQRGARHVTAIDVGHGQLHERLVGDPRVTSYERTNIRAFDADRLGAPVDIVVADLSFISLRSVVRHLLGLVRSGGDVVVLIKPQFEAGKVEASRGRGVITDPAIWTRVLGEVIDAFDDAGAAMMDVMPSPIRGADGNVEFLLHTCLRPDLERPQEGSPRAAIVNVVAEAQRSAGDGSA